MVRISGIDPTRPAREMQSGIRCRSALACSCTIATQHNTSNSNRLQATGESVMRPELTGRSEEHTSELQSLMRISYAVFCLKKKKNKPITQEPHKHNTTKENNTKRNK